MYKKIGHWMIGATLLFSACYPLSTGSMKWRIKSNIFEGRESVSKLVGSALGLNSGSKSVYRPQSHSFKFNPGLVF